VTALAQLEQSIAKYESYIQADPGNALLWLMLGDFYHRAGRFEEALASFERSLIESPEHTAAHSRVALVYISMHRFPEAATILRQLLVTTPDDPTLRYNLGLALFYQKQWDAAEHEFSRALALGLRSPDNLSYLTRCLHHLGKTREAIEFCAQWLAESRDDTSQAYLALLEMDHGNMAQASQLANEVLTRSPDNIDASIVVGTFSVEQQEIATAEKLFSNILKFQPNNPRAWLGLGVIHLYQQRHQDAISALETAASLMPENSGTVVALAWARLAARDFRGAEKTFRDAIKVDHNFAEAYGGLASALALQGRVDAARTEARVANRLNPANFGGHFANTVILKILGKTDLATSRLAELLQQAPAPGALPLIEHLRLYGAKHLQSPSAGMPDGPTT
jgi:tetratricopeptide (TPR) repeat protein